MNPNLFNVFLVISFIIGIIFGVTLINHLFDLVTRKIRKSRLQTLAKDFNLNFQFGDAYRIKDFFKPYPFKIFKRNIISGILDNRKIELYDQIIIPFTGTNGSQGRQDTILKIDERLVKHHGDTDYLVVKIMSVQEIRELFNDLSKAKFYDSN